ncbi:hypothetical protein EBZ37_09035, partial [bacterium]|nr:hypothetical protein [bacterium]
CVELKSQLEAESKAESESRTQLQLERSSLAAIPEDKTLPRLRKTSRVFVLTAQLEMHRNLQTFYKVEQKKKHCR